MGKVKSQPREVIPWANFSANLAKFARGQSKAPTLRSLPVCKLKNRFREVFLWANFSANLAKFARAKSSELALRSLFLIKFQSQPREVTGKLQSQPCEVCFWRNCDAKFSANLAKFARGQSSEPTSRSLLAALTAQNMPVGKVQNQPREACPWAKFKSNLAKFTAGKPCEVFPWARFSTKLAKFACKKTSKPTSRNLPLGKVNI